jgi:hypothetical protein
MVYRAPVLVSVRVPFLVLVLSGACSISGAWRLSRGALTSPYHQKQILECVELWEWTVARAIGNIWNVVRLPFAPWRRT